VCLYQENKVWDKKEELRALVEVEAKESRDKVLVEETDADK
jgi:hypothetical protein